MHHRIAAVMALCTLCGCGVPAWQTARTSIRAAQAALGPIEEGLPATDDAAVALAATRSTLDLGISLTEAWEAQDELPWAWPGWVSQALESAATIVTIIKDAGVEVPPYIATAIGGLQLLLPIISALTGGSS
jgi:hypothetical protein